MRSAQTKKKYGVQEFRVQKPANPKFRIAVIPREVNSQTIVIEVCNRHAPPKLPQIPGNSS